MGDLPKLRSLLPQRPLNYGVLMRWIIALHGMEAYFAEVPAKERTRIMRSWGKSVHKIIEEKNTPLVEVFKDKQEGDQESEQAIALSTIVSFRCHCRRVAETDTVSSMSTEELRRVQFLMATDLSSTYPTLPEEIAKARCFIGQPVDLNPDAPAGTECVNVLRVALSAPLVHRIWEKGEEAIAAEDRVAFDKLVRILNDWHTFSADAKE